MRAKLKDTIDFIDNNGGAVTSFDIAKHFNVSIQSARTRLNYMYKLGFLTREQLDKQYIYRTKNLAGLEYDKPYSVYKEKTKTGVIVRFGDMWRPERALRTAGSVQRGKSSIMYDE